MRPTSTLLLATAGLVALLLAWVTQPVAARAPTGAPAAVSPERLRQHVERLAGAYAARHFANPRVLDQAADFIAGRFAAVGGRVQRQAYTVDGAGYQNVIARFGPDGPAPLIIGAHYDAEQHTPGADDNASGVAGLLELARLLGERAPAVAVELVAYTLEEPPFFRTDDMGSRRHAAALAAAGVMPRQVVVLEMIGYFDDAPGSQAYPLPGGSLVYPDRAGFIAVVGGFAQVRGLRAVKAAMAGATPLPVRSISAPAWLPGIDFSDHASYWRHGMPAVMVTDTSFYRNAEYHRTGDLPARLDYRRMAQVVQGVEAYVRSLEGGGAP